MEPVKTKTSVPVSLKCSCFMCKFVRSRCFVYQAERSFGEAGLHQVMPQFAQVEQFLPVILHCGWYLLSLQANGKHRLGA